MAQRKIQQRIEPTLAPDDPLTVRKPAAAAAHGAQAVEAEVTAVIHATAEAWNSQDYSRVLALWDPGEALPFYLAEEQEDWFIGWEKLRAYLDPPHPSPAVQGIREEMRDIRVKQIGPDLALAAWWMHFEMKIIGRKPVGEEVRVSAVLRRTSAGWRYIHWAESPMTGVMYMQKLMERDVDEAKFGPMVEQRRKQGQARR
jgi:hypothetical protein